MHLDIESAIARYTEWDKPWTFHDRIAALISDGDRNVFDALWNEALDPNHWKDRDLGTATVHAEQAIAASFPQFSLATIAAIVRAASYEWR